MPSNETLSRRWHISPGASPSPCGHDSVDAGGLESMNSVHHLASPSPPSTEGGWQPTERILSDLSAFDFDRQAIANSLAASKAMSISPSSISHVPQPHPPHLRVGSGVAPPLWATESRRHPSHPAQTTSGSNSFLPPRPEFEEEWFQAAPQQTLNDPTPDAWRYRDPIPQGWRQPRFRPGHKHEEIAARDRLQPPVLGGKSKKDQLGSVNASWGDIGEAGPKVYGMFEIEQDPPSRSTSPFREEVVQVYDRPAVKEVRMANAETVNQASKDLRLRVGQIS